MIGSHCPWDSAPQVLFIDEYGIMVYTCHYMIGSKCDSDNTGKKNRVLRAVGSHGRLVAWVKCSGNHLR